MKTQEERDKEKAERAKVRAERRKQWDEEEKQRAAQFPGAGLQNGSFPECGYFAGFDIEEGSPTCLRIRKWGKWNLQPDTNDWEYQLIDLSEDVVGLARFIRALVCRYNALVKAANKEAAAVETMDPFIPMDPLGEEVAGTMR